MKRILLTLVLIAFGSPGQADLTISWDKNILTTHGDFPGKELKTWYLEAYCRPGSTDRVWNETVIGHTTEKISASADGKAIHLRCQVKDGVVVDHKISAGKESITFDITAHNPTEKASEAHWVQPCIRVGDFTGGDKTNYIKRCFIIEDGKPAFMPTKDWAMKARYMPGQVWCPKEVPRDDVNPRPLNPNACENGLIGCVSADDQWLMAVAFEPYQELFQGVITCIHNDFRIGGLEPGATKTIRGKLWIMGKDFDRLSKEYGVFLKE